MKVVNFKKSRQELGLTQIQIAKAMNIDNSTVSGWETGKDTIPLKQLIKYANIYKYSLDYLFGISNVNNFTTPYEINLNNIGKRIKIIRTKNKLTIENVAKELNTTKSTFWAYENGKTLINTSFIYGLTKIFNGFSIDKLFN